ncbi:DUF1998 domain-containing protein [Mycobacterium asiaticum]|uniref:DUF1998 domain-containing protein n=1 Tax=Mycobacterium asiaticum TaxID=1790 RepID=UPI001FD5EBD9|nr:DUF1998 domain-containing protein [Mycobacterium asiaticum]
MSPGLRSELAVIALRVAQGASYAPEISRDDINGALSWSVEHPRSIVLFDTVPGGTGAAKKIAANIGLVVEIAIKRVTSCDCGQETLLWVSSYVPQCAVPRGSFAASGAELARRGGRVDFGCGESRGTALRPSINWTSIQEEGVTQVKVKNFRRRSRSARRHETAHGCEMLCALGLPN